MTFFLHEADNFGSSEITDFENGAGVLSVADENVQRFDVSMKNAFVDKVTGTLQIFQTFN